MRTITIHVSVPLAVAVGAGRAQYGDTMYGLTDADVGRLSPAARAVVVGNGASGKLGRCEQGNAAPLTVEAVTADAVVAAIEAEATRRAAQEAERAAREAEQAARVEAFCAAMRAAPVEAWVWRHADGSPHLRACPAGCDESEYRRLPSGPVHEGTRDAQRAASEHCAGLLRAWRAAQEAEREANAAALRAETRALVEQHGTADQLARLEAGVLPASEVSDLVEALLPTIDLPLCTVRSLGALYVHADHCDEDADADSEQWAGGYTAEQWAALAAVREAAASVEGADVSVDRDTVVCSCSGTRTTLSVRVSVTRAGHTATEHWHLPGLAPEERVAPH